MSAWRDQRLVFAALTVAGVAALVLVLAVAWLVRGAF